MQPQGRPKLGLRRSGESFSEVHADVDDLESQGFVSLDRSLVVGPSVRGQLGASLLARPLLGAGDQCTTDAPTAVFGPDIPTFDKPARSRRIASIGVRA